MRALHAAGDTGEALPCHARARRRLIEELGTEPGRRSRELPQEILVEHPLGHPAEPPTARRSAPVPPARSTPRPATTAAGLVGTRWAPPAPPSTPGGGPWTCSTNSARPRPTSCAASSGIGRRRSPERRHPFV
ncbi:BTAD domain-containing putative transcriptional regulator [Streptomyces sp. NPDC048324]|uniref:BTAD domain-containing putative transcriptional regulator n=1 Tax=Streptomyces sp. NPDC048324 TaxID=3157205 RepID=UPI0034194D71